MSGDKPYLGRCRECDYALFVQADQIITGASLKEVRAGEAPRRMADNGAILARCPNRHKVFRLNQIKGTYSEKFKCNATCQNAKGDECTCSCGGMNHGRGHAIPIMTLDVAPAKVKHIAPAEADRNKGAVVATTATATDGQLNYIKSLSESLGIATPYDSTPTREDASLLINSLKARLTEQRQANAPQEPSATERQMSFINRLMDERSMSSEARIEARRQFDAGLTKARASAWIERLLELPMIEQAQLTKR